MIADGLDDFDLPDVARCARLWDVGLPGYIAATTVDSDGQEHFVLAYGPALGRADVRYDVDCPDAPHEHVGQLPLEFVRRLTIARRRRPA